MERSLDVKIAAHRAAAQRRAAGLNPWAVTIRLGDVWRDGHLTYEQKRDEIVARLTASGWPAEDYLVEQLVVEISETVDEDEFNDCWAELLDRADLARVRIDTQATP